MAEKKRNQMIGAWALGLLVALAMGCGTNTVETRTEPVFKKPPTGTLLHSYEKQCKGNVYIKTYVREERYKKGVKKLIAAVERFSRNVKVLSQKNVYSSNGYWLEYVELVVCVPEKVAPAR